MHSVCISTLTAASVNKCITDLIRTLSFIALLLHDAETIKITELSTAAICDANHQMALWNQMISLKPWN